MRRSTPTAELPFLRWNPILAVDFLAVLAVDRPPQLQSDGSGWRQMCTDLIHLDRHQLFYYGGSINKFHTVVEQVRLYKFL